MGKDIELILYTPQTPCWQSLHGAMKCGGTHQIPNNVPEVIFDSVCSLSYNFPAYGLDGVALYSERNEVVHEGQLRRQATQVVIAHVQTLQFLHSRYVVREGGDL